MFSPFMEEHFHATDSKKLTPNLSDKERYTVHYPNLQLYLGLGIQVTEVHCVLQFEQSLWLKQYIKLNQDKRDSAKNEIDENFFKLMNKAVFGKWRMFVEDIIIIFKIFKRCVAKTTTFKRSQRILEDLLNNYTK